MSDTIRLAIDRREFLKAGVATLAATTLVSARQSATKYQLKSESQFRSEATQYRTAVGELRRILENRIYEKDPAACIAAIERFAPALNFQLSSLVILALANQQLVAAVRSRVSSQPKLEQFAADGLRNIKAFTDLDGVKTLRTEIDRVCANDRALLWSVSEALASADRSTQAQEGMKKAEEDAACAKVWSIVVAVVLVVIAVVVASESFGSASNGATGVAWLQGLLVAPLSEKYGPNLSDVVVERGHRIIDAGYARCVARARRLSKVEALPAMMRCQAEWLKEKSGWLLT